MNLIISPKDNRNKILESGEKRFENVKSFIPQGPTLEVVFVDGRTRYYPLEHIWWYGPEQDEKLVTEERTRPQVDHSHYVQEITAPTYGLTAQQLAEITKPMRGPDPRNRIPDPREIDDQPKHVRG